jgi:hypothetical protein
MSNEATDSAMRSSPTPTRRAGTAVIVAAAFAASMGMAAGATNDLQGAATHESGRGSSATEELAAELVRARAATAEYATDLDAAIADGYQIITPNMPRMGYHFLNPTITEFDVANPPILVYVDVDGSRQLAAFEWVWPEEPAEPPLEGATYGSFAAACHYADGSFIAADSEAGCADVNPDNGSPFGFWHPDLVTMHVWLWYPNPDGLFTGENPLVEPITGDGTSHSDDVASEPDPRECPDSSRLRHHPRCR